MIRGERWVRSRYHGSINYFSHCCDNFVTTTDKGNLKKLVYFGPESEDTVYCGGGGDRAKGGGGSPVRKQKTMLVLSAFPFFYSV